MEQQDDEKGHNENNPAAFNPSYNDKHSLVEPTPGHGKKLSSLKLDYN